MWNWYYSCETETKTNLYAYEKKLTFELSKIENVKTPNKNSHESAMGLSQHHNFGTENQNRSSLEKDTHT